MIGSAFVFCLIFGISLRFAAVQPLSVALWRYSSVELCGRALQQGLQPAKVRGLLCLRCSPLAVTLLRRPHGGGRLPAPERCPVETRHPGEYLSFRCCRLLHLYAEKKKSRAACLTLLMISSDAQGRMPLVIEEVCAVLLSEWHADAQPQPGKRAVRNQWACSIFAVRILNPDSRICVARSPSHAHDSTVVERRI